MGAVRCSKHGHERAQSTSGPHRRVAPPTDREGGRAVARDERDSAGAAIDEVADAPTELGAARESDTQRPDHSTIGPYVNVLRAVTQESHPM